MYEHELMLNAMSEAYLQRLVADLSDEQLARQPHPGMNHPAWILGHLAVAYDFATAFLSARPKLSDWYPTYAPGSQPMPNRSTYPTKAVLLDAFADAGNRVRSAIPNADVEKLKEPHPFDPVKPFLSTKGHMISYILSSHISGHLGQLSTWRRVCGLPSV